MDRLLDESTRQTFVAEMIQEGARRPKLMYAGCCHCGVRAGARD
jgi:hypothetical protein